MEFPAYIRLGLVSLHPHWIFETGAWTIGFWLYARARRTGGDVVDARVRRWVIAAAAVGGLVGSRILHLLEDPSQTALYWRDPAFLLGGKTIVGGLIGGLIGVEWIKRRLGVTTATGDLLALPLITGIAIGRIGCFLTGLEDHAYGTATALPWGVDFGDAVPRHPAQLYETVFLAVLGAAVVNLRRRPYEVGDQFKVFMVGYLGWRLVVDFIKPGVTVAGFSMIQWACVAALAYYAPHVPRLGAWCLRSKRVPEAV